MKPVDSNSVYDMASLAKLKGDAKVNPQGELATVAKQFEAIFVQMMMKSMNQASQSMRSDMFQSNAKDMFQDMQLSELASHASNQGGIGLASLIEKQLSQLPQFANHPSSSPVSLQKNEVNMTDQTQLNVKRFTQSDQSVNPLVKKVAPQNTSNNTPLFEDATAFIKGLQGIVGPYAQSAGIEPNYLLAQAALESGWGRFTLKDDAGDSHNLFNIKASQDWRGKTIQRSVLEFVEGIPTMMQSQFKRYDNIEHALQDFVKLMQSSRYQGVNQHQDSIESYGQFLQTQGFATDPSYANKLKAVLTSALLRMEQ